MQTIILVIHVLLALGLIGVVLMQRSEGGGLGIGGGGASGGLGLMSGRTTANLLTRTTAILAGAFMFTSILLAVLGGGTNRGSVLDRAPNLTPLTIPAPAAPFQPAPAPVVPAPTVPGAAPPTQLPNEVPVQPAPFVPAPATAPAPAATQAAPAPGAPGP